MMDISKLEKILEEHGREFAVYLDLLLKWNRTYNLTAITEPDDIWEKHFLDSITPLHFLPEFGLLLDIGTGAGFPGIPLKIVRPALSVTLLEATQKKCNFCSIVIRELGLKDMRVVHGRDIAGKFDIIISRATFSLKEFAKCAAPYLKDASSMLIAMKGDDITAELKEAQGELKKLGLKTSLEKYSLSNVSPPRTLVKFHT